MSNVVHITWMVGTRPIGNWTVFPWVHADKKDWVFTWIFIFISREVDIINEVGEEM